MNEYKQYRKKKIILLSDKESKQAYKKYRKKIDNIMKNNKHMLVGEFTIYTDEEKKGWVLTHFVTELTLFNRKKVTYFLSQLLLGTEDDSIKAIDLGKLK